jgi:hypothetical protein
MNNEAYYIGIRVAETIDLMGDGYNQVLAETADGQRFILSGFSHRDLDRVEAMAKRVRDRGYINLAHWVETWPRYGSDAFLNEEAEAGMWASAIRDGFANEADVPDNLRTLL